LFIVVQLQNEDSGKNLSDIVNETIELFLNSLDSNVTIVSSNSITINGVEAYEFNIEGKYENSEYATKGKLIHITNNEKYFDIVVECTPSSLYEEHESEINQIINSFEIT